MAKKTMNNKAEMAVSIYYATCFNLFLPLEPLYRTMSSVYGVDSSCQQCGTQIKDSIARPNFNGLYK